MSMAQPFFKLLSLNLRLRLRKIQVILYLNTLWLHLTQFIRDIYIYLYDQGGFLNSSIGKALVTRLTYIQITIVEQCKCSIVLARFI